MTTHGNPAFSPDALYAKSKVYILRGLRALDSADRDEYQLWASLALELLGKSALSRVHPALIADPTHPASLFAACGRPISPDTKTITAKTLFERLSHIDKNFDSLHQKFCEQMAIRRNAELHSGESPFSGMSAESWEREYWGAVEIVLGMQDETLDSWLGAEKAEAPTIIIKQAEEAVGFAVTNRLARSRAAFEARHKTEASRLEAIHSSQSLPWADHSWDGRDRVRCPACGALAFVGGTLWEEEVVDSNNDEPEPGSYEQPWEIVQKSFTVEAFHCPTCGLTLSGTKEIAAAGLKDEFVHEEEREMEFEPDYGND